MTSFRAACVQMRSGISVADNVEASLVLIEEAARAGATFIATPEMTTVVDRKAQRLLAALPDGEDDAVLGRYAGAARRLGVWLLIGSMAVKVRPDTRPDAPPDTPPGTPPPTQPATQPGEKAANRSFLFSPAGEIVARYDKIHMFDVDLDTGESWRESSVYDAGSSAVVVETPLASFGLSVCYDLRFARLYRALAQQGAAVLTVPSAFTKPTGAAHWETLLRARAIENGAFVIAPAQGGQHEDGRETYGHSMIIDPWGRILAASGNDSPGIILAEIDLEKSRAARAQIPCLSLDATFHVERFGP